ncbi:AP2-associated protein kinase 1-like [Sturnira hondurensis]|uniref:AP2-associated protein kinase 1-like n=1 Tax=Sturnira hondurensis TaxID=192404 RepID=UPI001879A036|nr:AP2-associated protein kinase 1-like [Sturnira hondurensis]
MLILVLKHPTLDRPNVPSHSFVAKMILALPSCKHLDKVSPAKLFTPTVTDLNPQHSSEGYSTIWLTKKPGASRSASPIEVSQPKVLRRSEVNEERLHQEARDCSPTLELGDTAPRENPSAVCPQGNAVTFPATWNPAPRKRTSTQKTLPRSRPPALPSWQGHLPGISPWRQMALPSAGMCHRVPGEPGRPGEGGGPPSEAPQGPGPRPVWGSLSLCKPGLNLHSHQPPQPHVKLQGPAEGRPA